MSEPNSKLSNFDPNGLAMGDNIYGLPYSLEEAKVVIFPVPWEVTVSYASGTAKGPEAILEASAQVDLFDPAVKDAWKIGLAMDEISGYWLNTGKQVRKKAKKMIEALENGEEQNPVNMAYINQACLDMVNWVEESTAQFIKSGKRVALLGGDHSTPLGYMKALAKKHKKYGILQIDAHADLRNAYEGFEYSHASIMTNALKIKEVSKLVQVGIRDYCDEEFQVIQKSKGRVKTFFDRDLKIENMRGKTWEAQVNDIINELPDKVYLSFDIDGLDPKLCPNTGTPVAGGFEFEQVLFLVEQVIKSGKELIGFDLNEVAPGKKDEWDANVGARLLYRLCNLLGSQK